jgi:hypothetical protein
MSFGGRWTRVLGLFSIAAALPVSAEDGSVWNLKADQAACLQKNVDAYLALNEDPLVIFLAACPETDLVKIMAQSSQNMAIAEVDRQEDSAEQPAEVITFTRAQLQCLMDLKLESGQAVVQVPRDPGQ